MTETRELLTEGSPPPDNALGPSGIWRASWWTWVLLAGAAALVALIFRDALVRMAGAWATEEYSHGYILPFVAAFLVWQRSARLAQTQFVRSWLGVGMTVLGLLIYVVGELSTLFVVMQYAFLITLGGVLLAFMGREAFRLILPAYVLLFFLVPMPVFFYNNLSAELQLISSQLGVFFIRLFGISVFIEGNVIDLGSLQLQVVDACSGLRYLFPLTALGYIAAVLFKGAFWKKSVLFFSSVPIAVLMNSLRIGVIGILVERSGIGMAEGFIHDFEGWVVFMSCAALLVAIMWILARVGKNPLPLSEAFSIGWPDSVTSSTAARHRPVTPSFYATLPLLMLMAVFSIMLPHRLDVVPQRTDLLFFPNAVGEWRGRTGRLDKAYVDALKVDDYLIADYTKDTGAPVSLYVAYYESQRKGASVHSPKSCLPGGGWEIQELSQRDIPDVVGSGASLRVNRALIQMGDERMLVYYWFPQRGRVVTDEFLVKWYLLWDALLRNRTDGGLVRLTAPVGAGQDVAAVDALLSEFAASIARPLKRFVPD